MKHTTGRVRILDAMAKPGAYARPDLSVTGLPPQIYRIKPEMVQMFARAKMIVEAKPPKQEGVLGYVWVITDKGREWLKQAANTKVSGRPHHETEKER